MAQRVEGGVGTDTGPSNVRVAGKCPAICSLPPPFPCLGGLSHWLQTCLQGLWSGQEGRLHPPPTSLPFLEGVVSAQSQDWVLFKLG